jgi:uncharacterized protein (TIGR03000 family)
MYSVVLMAALATAADTPNWHGRGGCHGCYGGGYSGCYGGCYGGGYGGCYGGGGYGGCYGGGGYGGCYGGGYTGCSGGAYNCHGCYGCYGCYGCTGYSPGTSYAPTVRPAAPAAQPAAQPESVPAPKPAEDKEAAAARAAKLIVELPADAQLYVDDQLMKATSAQRTFNTPALEAGQTYYYILRAEVIRDGKPQSETKRVLVRAGEVSRAAFPRLESITTVRAER